MVYSPFDAVDKSGDRGAAVHAAALMRSFGIVFDEVLIKNSLHLLEGLKQAESVRRADEFAGPGKMICRGPTCLKNW